MLVDAFSKWPEVKAVSSTTSKATINILRDIFSTYSFPQMVVSDNGPQLTSSAFQNFLSENHIIHHKSPPYHRATNLMLGSCFSSNYPMNIMPINNTESSMHVLCQASVTSPVEKLLKFNKMLYVLHTFLQYIGFLIILM